MLIGNCFVSVAGMNRQKHIRRYPLTQQTTSLTARQSSECTPRSSCSIFDVQWDGCSMKKRCCSQTDLFVVFIFQGSSETKGFSQLLRFIPTQVHIGIEPYKNIYVSDGDTWPYVHLRRNVSLEYIMWIIGFSGNQPLLNSLSISEHETYQTMRSGCTTFPLLWFAVGKGVFPINCIFLVHIQHFQSFLLPFIFCVWLLFTFSASFAFPCPLPYLRSRHTPFYAADFVVFFLPSTACVRVLFSRSSRLLRGGERQGDKEGGR